MSEFKLGMYGPHTVNAEFQREDGIRFVIATADDHDYQWVADDTNNPSGQGYTNDRAAACLRFTQMVGETLHGLVVGPNGSVVVERAGRNLLLVKARLLAQAVTAWREEKPFTPYGSEEDPVTFAMNQITPFLNQLMGLEIFTAQQLLNKEN